MILFPPAKINLGLNILNKRKDGYHELNSVMTPIPLTDIIEIVPSENFTFEQSGILIPDETENNLCVKAYRLFDEYYNIPPVNIHLKKIIPMGAGLGGGSSNAAYVLLGLNKIFNLNLPDNVLENMAAKLGSDCPFFIKNTTQLATGRGEILKPINFNLNGYYIKLLNIGIHVGTKEAYSNVQFSEKIELDKIIKNTIHSWQEKVTNDFEKSIFLKHPELKKIKEKFYDEGALFAAMSGSGSTIFGIYKEKPESSLNDYSEAFEFIGKI